MIVRIAFARHLVVIGRVGLAVMVVRVMPVGESILAPI